MVLTGWRVKVMRYRLLKYILGFMYWLGWRVFRHIGTFAFEVYKVASTANDRMFSQYIYWRYDRDE